MLELRMRYVTWFVLLAAGLGCDSALAVGRLADVTLVDRDTGVALAPHYFRGEYWVAGTPGARYAIEIRNRIGSRLLAVTSVDGVNVISGETAGWDQSGYVFVPGQGYQITGWRKSDAEIAAFAFTALPDSYAALTGRPANIGVIGVAVFRERPPPSVSVPSESNWPRRQWPAAGSESRAQAAAPTSPAASPPMASGDSAPKSQPDLGTGHGEREYSYVSHTEFRRIQDEPNEVIRIRYDSLEKLVAMGVLTRPHPTPVGADPFPASAHHYVPDPPS